MSRPIQYDHEELLASLRATFVELGPGASTAELARRAGVSEGTLFKRFGCKRVLFARAMQLPVTDEEDWFTALLGRAGKGSVQENLEILARAVLEHMLQVVPVMLMTFAHSGLTDRDLRAVLGEEEALPLQVRRRVGAYFAAEMDLGRMRRVDARTMANMFLGTLTDRAMRSQHADVLLDETDDFDRFVQTLARTLTDLTRLD